MIPNNKDKQPAVTWLRVTDYMHNWLEQEFGCNVRIHGRQMICLQDIKGAREVLRMETSEDIVLKQKPTYGSMSATRYSCIHAGLRIDPCVVKDLYGIDNEEMEFYMPIECPRRCITKHGVLRPWTNDVCFGRQQTNAMQKLIREEFFRVLDDYSDDYALEHHGEKYTSIDILEGFCKFTGTSDIYIPTIRREWQRRKQWKRSSRS